MEGDSNVHFSLALKLVNDLKIVESAFNFLLRRKNNILNSLVAQQEIELLRDQPEALELFGKLDQRQQEYARLSFKGSDPKNPQAYKKRLDDLREQMEDLEGQLARISTAWAQTQEYKKANLDSILKVLPDDLVLVEFSKNFILPFIKKQRGSGHYIAFIQRKGENLKPAMIDLVEAKKIDRAIADFRREVEHTVKDRNLQVSETHLKAKGKALSQLVFEPLLKEIGDSRQIFLSPDANLSLIPFETLTDNAGRYLIESYTFSYPNSGRDLLRFHEKRESRRNEKMVLMGHPDFDSAEAPGNVVAMSRERGRDRHRSRDITGISFSSLPGTGAEIEGITSLYQDTSPEVYVQKRASEENLKQLRSPYILHIATHGFFLEEQKWNGNKERRGFSLTPLDSHQNPPIQKLTPIQLENPLLRSGIALAGANKQAHGKTDDGLVTAMEVSGMDLRGTDLMVLSACDTGVGETRKGQGVIVLRRAFQQAGVHSLVMSLWKVPDDETKDLMVGFYKRLKTGIPKLSALREASLSVMQTLKEKTGSTHPFYWGAFILVGDPGGN